MPAKVGKEPVIDFVIVSCFERVSAAYYAKIVAANVTADQLDAIITIETSIARL